MYDPLYDAIAEFERAAKVRVEVVAQLPHPELNAFVRQALESGVRLDVISTHTKYAPSQARWLSPLDEIMPAELIADLLPRPAELSRVDGTLIQIPRNLDVRLLHYRRDAVARVPQTWDELIEIATEITRSDSNGDRAFYGFLFPGRDSGLFGTFYELLVSAGGDLFDEDLRPAFDSARRPLGGRADRGDASRAARDAARPAQLALRRDLGVVQKRPTRRWCRTGREAITSMRTWRRVASQTRLAWRCCLPVRQDGGLRMPDATPLPFRGRPAIARVRRRWFVTSRRSTLS